MLSSWAIPVLAVGLLAIVSVGFAVLVGRWIDAQSQSVVDEPRVVRRRPRTGGKE